MKTRRRSRKGGTRKVQFNRSIKNNNYYEPNESTNRPNYLPNLLTAVRRHRPQPSNLHEHDAAIYAAVMESHNSPHSMYEHLKAIYEVVPLTQTEYTLVNDLFKNRGFVRAIDILTTSPLPPATKEKLLNYIRFSRAVKKLQHAFSKNTRSSQRFVHEEWGPNTNE